MPIDQLPTVRIETVLPFLAEDNSLGLSLIAFDGRGFHFLFDSQHGLDALRELLEQWEQMIGRVPRGH
jgi:hypothetical protein